MHNDVMKVYEEQLPQNGNDSVSIDTLGLPTRTRNALVRSGIKTVFDLRHLIAKEGTEGFLGVRGIGQKSIEEIYRALELELPPPVSKPPRKNRVAETETSIAADWQGWGDVVPPSSINFKELIEKQMRSNALDYLQRILSSDY